MKLVQGRMWNCVFVIVLQLLEWQAELKGRFVLAGSLVMEDPTSINEKFRVEYDIQVEKLAKRVEEDASSYQVKPIDIDVYRYETPTDYTMGIIIDPCYGKEAWCCQDKFGTPIYRVEGSERFSASGTSSIVDKNNNTLLIDTNRIADRFSRFDPECFVDEDGTPFRLRNGVKTYDDALCVDRLHSFVDTSEIEFPACWDFNSSVNADASCYAVDGLKRLHCISVGYTQTAYIYQCGKQYAFHNHCGTFLELHKKDDETILSQTRLLGEYPSGYRTTTLPLYYKGDRTRTVCRGDYEIWWVQRTKYDFIVQYKKKFYVSQPGCDFDAIIQNAYVDYHTIGNTH